MKHLKAIHRAAAACAAAALVSGCAMHVGTSSHGGPGPRSGGGKANADPSQPLPLLACDVANPGCMIPVQRSTGTPTEDPVTGTWDCGVRVPELIIVRRPVAQLQWTLPANLPEQNAFRFKVVQLAGSPSGVFPYAREAMQEFTLQRVSDTLFEFTVRARSNKGYAYGIYLEWQPPKSTEWKVCTPLDPIIVSME
jgi:hypothetical protein